MKVEREGLKREEKGRDKVNKGGDHVRIHNRIRVGLCRLVSAISLMVFRPIYPSPAINHSLPSGFGMAHPALDLHSGHS
jgi:hypothetical protein